MTLEPRFRIDERVRKDGRWWTIQRREPWGEWRDVPIWGHAPVTLYSLDDAEARLRWLIQNAGAGD